MIKKNFKYIYGPLYSWRLGLSLGVDPVSEKSKVCNFNCLYCQLGKTRHLTSQRREFVKTKDIMTEIRSLASEDFDYLTFSGRGEPTLAKNLGEMIGEFKKNRKEKVAVITNASLMDQKGVQKDLCWADFVLAKLDACSQETLDLVDKAREDIRFESIVAGIKSFRSSFRGKLALQIMFIAQNKNYAPQIAAIVRDIKPDEVQLNTPLRPSPVQPLTKEEMSQIKNHFLDLNAVCVYDKPSKDVQPFDNLKTMQRHGHTNHKG